MRATLETLPSDLGDRADSYDDGASQWTAQVAGNQMYVWRLDPMEVFTRENMAHWLAGIVANHGYPVRLHWRRSADKFLLHSQPLWGAENPATDNGFAPVFAGSQPMQVEVEALDPLNRLIKWIVEEPQVAADAFRTVVDAFKPDQDARDQRLLAQFAAISKKHVDSAAESAVRRKMGELMVDAGYELDGDGNIIEDEDELYPLDDEAAAVANGARLRADAARQLPEMAIETLASVATSRAEVIEPEPEPEPATQDNQTVEVRA